MLIVSSNGTFVKSEITSNDTSEKPFRMFCFLIFSVNSLVFLLHIEIYLKVSTAVSNTLQGGKFLLQNLILLA